RVEIYPKRDAPRLVRAEGVRKGARLIAHQGEERIPAARRAVHPGWLLSIRPRGRFGCHMTEGMPFVKCRRITAGGRSRRFPERNRRFRPRACRNAEICGCPPRGGGHRRTCGG